MNTKIVALTKDKLIYVLGFIGNHDNAVLVGYIEQLYDKYGDIYEYDSKTNDYKLVSENRYWQSGWKDKNGTFTNSFEKYKNEIIGYPKKSAYKYDSQKLHTP